MKDYKKVKIFLILALQIITSLIYAQQPQTAKEKEYIKNHRIKSSLTVINKLKMDSIDKIPKNICRDFYSILGTKTVTIIYDCSNILYNTTDSLPRYIYLYGYDIKRTITKISWGIINSDIYTNAIDTVWKGITLYKNDVNGNIIEKRSYSRNEPAFVGTELEPYILSAYKYDLKGNVIEEVQGSTSSPNINVSNEPSLKIHYKYFYKYKYDNNGKILKKTKAISNDLTEEYEYKYDSLSNVLEEFKHYFHNSIYSGLAVKISYIIDSKGLLMQNKMSSSSGLYSIKSSYSYSNSEIEEIQYSSKYNGQDSIIGKRKYLISSYDSLFNNKSLLAFYTCSVRKDSLGRITKEFFYDKQGKLQRKIETQYYSDNKIKDREIFSLQDDIGNEELINYYYNFYEKK